MLTLKGGVRIELIHIQYCFKSTQPSNLSDTQWVTQDTVKLYADTQRRCEDRVDSYTILLHVDYPIYPDTQWVTQDTVLYADTQRSCEDRVDSYTILLHVDSAIQFILILNELLRIQFNFMLTPKGAVRIELILLCFSYSKFNVYNFYHYRIMLFSYYKQLSILSVCESVCLWDGLCVLKDMCLG